jgi:hypothetical protein
MQFIGGGSQQEFVERTRGLDPSRCLEVPYFFRTVGPSRMG